MERAPSGLRRSVPFVVMFLVLWIVSACETPRTTPATGATGVSAIAASGQAQATIGRFQVPLPPGKWKEAFSGSQNLSRGTSHRKILIGVSGDVIDRVILLYLIEIGGRDYFKPRKNCTHTDYFFQTTTVSETAKEDCWHVRNVSMGLSGDPHWINEALDLYAKKLDLYFPAVLVGARFIRHQDSELLQVDYLWNPDMVLPRGDGRVWAAEDWSNPAVAGDPGRKLVMDEIRRWALDWHPRIERAFPF